ncbi:C-type lectin lectoxin-Lio1-like [Ptychodera flava]|uniref:C-type lectin lectoxin-Lio1-like n=1 Tax=Ptychodera flava TaxID=63121 RepID=UPI00396AB161
MASCCQQSRSNQTYFEDEFFWTDGSLTAFKNWAPGEPSNTGSGGEDCATMYGAGRKCEVLTPMNTYIISACPHVVLNLKTLSYITTATCHPIFRAYGRIGGNMLWTILVLFVIQLVSAESEPQAAATTGTCPHNFNEWNGNCYRVYTSSTNYGNADANCRTTALGAHLASIKSSDENAYVVALISSDAWIGYDDLAKEGDFYWTDGSLTGYKNWAPGEPNNKGISGEDCTLMFASGSDRGQWNDENCGDNKHYVCKAPLDPTPCL